MSGKRDGRCCWEDRDKDEGLGCSWAWMEGVEEVEEGCRNGLGRKRWKRREGVEEEVESLARRKRRAEI